MTQDGSEGRRMWRRVTASVRPLRPPAPMAAVAPPTNSAPPPPLGRPAKAPRAASLQSPSPCQAAPRPAAAPRTPPQTVVGAAPVDGTWERALKTGRLAPDLVVDLHGHSLARAHASLNGALDRAASSDARLVLVIAGKLRGAGEAPRGAIRHQLADWLAHSRHAPRILAVRGAHPRHGGAGAVYVLLRKR